MARIAIVDDHPFFRLGAEAALREAGHEIAASTGDSSTALDTIMKSDSQVVLLDQRMSPVPGSTILKSLRQRGDERPVIVFANELSDEALLEIMRSRVNGIVFKHCPQERLLEAIKTVLTGGRFIDGMLIDKAMDLSAETGSDPIASKLTQREAEVARLVAKGLRNRQIGDELAMTEGTVKVYLHNIYRKLGLSNRAGLALLFGSANNDT